MNIDTLDDLLDNMLKSIAPVVPHYFDLPENGKIEKISVYVNPDDSHEFGVTVVWMKENHPADLEQIPFEGQQFIRTFGWEYRRGFQTTRAVATKLVDFDRSVKSILTDIMLMPGDIGKTFIQELVKICFSWIKERQANFGILDSRHEVSKMAEVEYFTHRGEFERRTQTGVHFFNSANANKVLEDLSYISSRYFGDDEILPAICKYYDDAELADL